MSLPDPNHDLPHLSPAQGESLANMDHVGTLTLFSLAVVGALAVVVVNLAIG